MQMVSYVVGYMYIYQTLNYTFQINAAQTTVSSHKITPKLLLKHLHENIATLQMIVEVHVDIYIFNLIFRKCNNDHF